MLIIERMISGLILSDVNCTALTIDGLCTAFVMSTE